MHQNVFGGWAPPGPTWGAYSAPRTPRWILGVGAGKGGEGRRGGKGEEEGKGGGERRGEEIKGGKTERKEEGRDHPNKKLQLRA